MTYCAEDQRVDVFRRECGLADLQLRMRAMGGCAAEEDVASRNGLCDPRTGLAR